MDRIRTVAIVGVGLIGASLGLALRRGEPARRVVGIDADPGALDTALRRGAIDEGMASMDGVKDADLVIVAVPPDAVVDVALKAARVMKAGSILLDVASTKARIVQRLDQELPPHVRYVGGHPMAGSEGQGADAADAALLDGRPFVLTPTARTDPAALHTLAGIIAVLRMRVVVIGPDVHDDLVAQVSHLPYLLAVAAVTAADGDAIGLHGPAFAGLARIAAGPPALWAQISRGNAGAIKRALAKFRQTLDQIEQAVDGAQPLDAMLEDAWRRAQAVRR